MAVAVKTSDARSQGTPASVQVLSLIVLVYLLASLVVVFWAIPTYAPQLLASNQIVLRPYVQSALIGMVMAAVGLVLAWLGSRVFATQVVGVRAGVFTAFVSLLLILLTASWFGGVMEWLTFEHGWFGSSGRIAGITTTAVFTGILVLLFLRWFFATGTAKWLQEFEEGGWFSWTGYKPQQGLRVRRGTVIGILLLGGAGVYSLVAGNTLAKYDGWSVGVPFTGTITLRVPTTEEIARGDTGPIGDAAPLFKQKLDWDGESSLVMDRWFLRDEINANLDPARFVYLNLDPATQRDLGLENGVMLRSDFQKKLDDLRAEGKPIPIDEGPESPDLRAPVPAGNPSGRKDRERLYQSDSNQFVTLSYAPVPLLPHVRFALPLLLLVLTLWLAWRITNFPPFADFLIATEAEMNKVSWTTRRRLVQDTIVVLVTVLLMAGFLLLVDLTCRNVLGSEWIRVIQISSDAEGAQKSTGPKPW